MDLSLNLRQQVKRRKLDPKVNGAETPLELSTCLKNFTSSEKLEVDAYTCQSKECGATPQKARKHLTIKKLPPTLCIQLKVRYRPLAPKPARDLPSLRDRQRYEHNKTNPQKLDTRLHFPLQLDMCPYTTRAYRNRKRGLEPGDPLVHRSPGWYDLSCVVVHVGTIDAGHYICYCRRDDQWFKFDDSKVTLASEAQVLSSEAYLLFYVLRCLGTPGGQAEA
jgi:ubiquitin carboxyl-terminal hydrolase 22/27/51